MTAGPAPDAASDDADLRREGERIAQLLEDVAELAVAPVRQRVEELVSRLVHLYGAGLAGLLRILGGDRLDEGAKARLLADPLVSSLLVLHGIHPAPESARDLDPGESPPAHAPARAPAGAAAGLVQIDLARSRAPRSEGEP